ncbi:unnamed protein product [Trifolium pratense]|uniref:Uncharacterized protein n=1 Tax=Trifolium pratense TaxID=57577 RepID=A0ACB0KJT3_TRIPR|nr:unnamed protein product [Trifolium pratense]
MFSCVPPSSPKCVSFEFVVVTDITAQGKLNCEKDSDCFMFSCFVYLMILFICFFLVVIDVNAQRRPRCKENSDCSEFPCVLPMTPKCVAFKCRCRLD